MVGVHAELSEKLEKNNEFQYSAASNRFDEGTQTMFFKKSLPVLLSLVALSLLSVDAYSGDKKNRETDKLKKRDISELSVQQLVDIYTGCLASAYTDEREEVTTVDERGSETYGPVSRKAIEGRCKDERKHLVKFAPDANVDVLKDQLLTSWDLAD